MIPVSPAFGYVTPHHGSITVCRFVTVWTGECRRVILILVCMRVGVLKRARVCVPTCLCACTPPQSAWREVSQLSRELFMYANCTPWNTTCLYTFAQSVVSRERSLFPPAVTSAMMAAAPELRDALWRATVDQDAEKIVGEAWLASPCSSSES